MEEIYENLLNTTRLLQYQRDFLSITTETTGNIKRIVTNSLKPSSLWNEDFEYYSDREVKKLIIKNFKTILNKYPDHFDCKFYLAKEYLDSNLHEIRYCSYSELVKIDNLKTKEYCELEKFADNIEQIILHEAFEYRKYAELLFQYDTKDIFKIINAKFKDSLQEHVSKAIFYIFLDDIDKARNEIKLSFKYGLNIEQFNNITRFYKKRLDGIYGYQVGEDLCEVKEGYSEITSEFLELQNQESQKFFDSLYGRQVEKRYDPALIKNEKFYKLYKQDNDVSNFRIHDNFSFGKYKEETVFSIGISDLPYLLWCILNVNFFAVDFYTVEFFIRDLPNSEKYLKLNRFKQLMFYKQMSKYSTKNDGPDDSGPRAFGYSSWDAMTLGEAFEGDPSNYWNID